MSAAEELERWAEVGAVGAVLRVDAGEESMVWWYESEN
jgi:hypothetical protein